MSKGEILLPNLEKLALAGQGLEIMPEEDAKEIIACLTELGGDDPAKFMRKVLFYLKGRVWGESLFVAKKGELLPKEEILMEMMAVASADDVSLMYEVMAGGMEGFVKYGHDVILYLVMMRDLGGEVVAERAKDYLCLSDWPRDQLNEEEKIMLPFYLSVAGRNVWEWEDDQILMLLPYLYKIWENGMRNYHTVFDDEVKEALSTSLKDLRVRLRDLSRVLIQRKISTDVLPHKTLLELSNYH